MTQYGTAIRGKHTGKILDIELADSLSDAEDLRNEMNLRISSYREPISIEWVVVRIEAEEN